MCVFSNKNHLTVRFYMVFGFYVTKCFENIISTYMIKSVTVKMSITVTQWRGVAVSSEVGQVKLTRGRPLYLTNFDSSKPLVWHRTLTPQCFHTEITKTNTKNTLHTSFTRKIHSVKIFIF